MTKRGRKAGIKVGSVKQLAIYINNNIADVEMEYKKVQKNKYSDDKPTITGWNIILKVDSKLITIETLKETKRGAYRKMNMQKIVNEVYNILKPRVSSSQELQGLLNQTWIDYEPTYVPKKRGRKRKNHIDIKNINIDEVIQSAWSSNTMHVRFFNEQSGYLFSKEIDIPFNEYNHIDLSKSKQVVKVVAHNIKQQRIKDGINNYSIGYAKIGVHDSFPIFT